MISISSGATDTQLHTVWQAVFQFQPENTEHQVIQELRLPFAVAGAMMHGMTRNPLADPGLLGVNAGAAFVLPYVLLFFPTFPSIF